MEVHPNHENRSCVTFRAPRGISSGDGVFGRAKTSAASRGFGRSGAPGRNRASAYAPGPILPGGMGGFLLHPSGSPFLKADRVTEAEQYNMSQSVPGRISSIVNIHNPSIEVHTVDRD